MVGPNFVKESDNLIVIKKVKLVVLLKSPDRLFIIVQLMNYACSE